MYQNRVIEVSGVFSGCAGWNVCGMYARYVHMDARVGRGLGQSPRQISSLTGKNEGRGSTYRRAGDDGRDDGRVRERHHCRDGVFRRLRVVLGACGVMNAHGKGG